MIAESSFFLNTRIYTLMQTKITIKDNLATGISSVHNGANINGLAFNLDHISKVNTELAKKLVELYEVARGLE